MSFLFASSHLPDNRLRRSDHEEEEDETLQPELRSGMVRAFSHLPVKQAAGDPAGPPSQHGAQGIGRQLLRRGIESLNAPHEDAIAAAKASGVFDAVRQQYNRSDSPHFMDEDGNLRPRDEARLPDSPTARDPRSPQRAAASTPRPAWDTRHDADDDDNADSSHISRTSPHASADTRPWYLPEITPKDH